MSDTIKLLYTRKEAASSLGISVRGVDYLIQRGELATKRIGKKVLVPFQVLRKYAASDHPEATQIRT